jgi:ribosomal protein S18 acetylase RimI-like enzyme
VTPAAAPRPQALVLRPARPADARPIAKILSDFIDDTSWMPRLHSRADDLGFCCRMVDGGGVTVAVADRVVGFVRLRGETVEALYVDCDWRDRGIGSALLDTAKSGAGRLDLWTFVANRRAQAFYLGHGFVEVAQTDGSGNAEGLPDIRYLWKDSDP